MNGGWSSWSSWSECTSSGQPNACGRGTRKQTRLCTNPTQLNGGRTCRSSDVQKGDCTSICPGRVWNTGFHVFYFLTATISSIPRYSRRRDLQRKARHPLPHWGVHVLCKSGRSGVSLSLYIYLSLSDAWFDRCTLYTLYAYCLLLSNDESVLRTCT